MVKALQNATVNIEQWTDAYPKSEFQFDKNTTMSYWKFRADTGDDFSSKIYSKLYGYIYASQYKMHGKDFVVTPDVGLISYAIWKACNNRVQKEQTTLQNLANKGINLTSEYPLGKKIENLSLTITNFKTSTYYDTTTIFVYGIQSTSNTKFKIKIKQEYNNPLYELYNFYTRNENLTNIKIKLSKIPLIVSGKVSKVYPEYNMVLLGYINLIQPTIQDIEVFKNNINQQKQVAKEKEDETLGENKYISNNPQIINQTTKILLGKMTDDDILQYTSGENKKETFKFRNLKAWIKDMIDSNKLTEFYKNCIKNNDLQLKDLSVAIKHALVNGIYQ